MVTTKEGREVVIPNAVIFTNPVAVEHKQAEKSPIHQVMTNLSRQ